MSLFGSNTNTASNNWGASSGFGRSASFSGPTGGSLFGNSNASNNANPSPSTTQGVGPKAGGDSGLFGNKRQSISSGSGLFGNSGTNSAPTAPAGPSGLFGNSTTNANTSTNTGGLFGNSAQNSTPNTGGLFGNTQNSTAPSGGLFGSTGASSGGLFGNSKPPATGGLFGGNTAASAAPNSNPSGGLFGAKPAGGLFGNSNSNTNTASGGLFGGSSNTNSTSGGLFGSSGSSGLFGNSASNNLLSSQNAPSIQPNLNSNPYNYDQVISKLQPGSNMPESITSRLFPEKNNKDLLDRKRRHSYLEPTHKPKSSLLTKLSQSLKVLRNPTTVNFASIKGLFTASNFVETANHQGITPKSKSLTTKRTQGKTLRTSYGDRGNGSIKRLVIKSKPLKFHLINADKVLNTKRRRIITEKSSYIQSDDDLSDEDTEQSFSTKPKDSRYSYKLDSEKKSKDAKVLSGESVKSNDIQNGIESNSNDGYWCSPSIEEILELSEAERADVEHFIIGRKGYGQISYDYAVDLNHVVSLAEKNNIPLNEQLFGKSVRIEKKVIQTPHGEDREPIGFGLNVPATVTLEGITPVGSISEYVKKLRSHTGMDFVTYDPITHVYVFKVKHFSVWGLVDEFETNDEQEYQSLVELKRKQDEKEHESFSEYSRVYENVSFNQEIKKQKLTRHTNGVPGGWSAEGNQQSNPENPLNVKKNLVANEIKTQLDSFRQEQKLEELNSHVNDITIDSDSDISKESSDSVVFDIVTNPPNAGNFDYLKQMVSVLPRNTYIGDIVDEKAYEPEIADEGIFDTIQRKHSAPTSRDWLVQLELANDINSALNPLGMDAQRKSKKSLTLSNVDEIVFSDFNRDSVNNSSPTKFRESLKLGNIEDIEDIDEDIYPNDIPQIIKQLRQQTRVSSRTNGYPFIETAGETSFSELILPGSILEEEQLLDLLSALFDSNRIDFESINQNDSAVVSRLTELQKRKVFGNWIRKYSQVDIERLSSQTQDSLESVFIQLSGGNIQAAIEIATASNNDHIAVVLTLADSGDDTVKLLARNQLNDWKETSSLSSIPKSVVKIYQILAGEFKEVVQSLPWILALGIPLFYGDDSLSLVSIFKDFLNDNKESSALIDILRFYQDVQDSSASITKNLLASTKLNNKLKWLTLTVLGDRLGIQKSQYDELTTSFGSYLLNCGLWQEAIYVNAHISDDNKAQEVLRQLIISNVQYIKDSVRGIDEEEALVSTFKIPRNLIDEAVAIKKESEGDYWSQAWALVRAQLWEDAHATVVRHLAPETIISNDSNLRDELLDLVSKFPQSGLIIPDWNKGAGIYVSFFKLTTDSSDTKQLEFLLDNVPLAKEKSTFETKTALKVISKRVGEIAIQNTPQPSNLRSRIESLLLGEVEKTYFRVRLGEK